MYLQKLSAILCGMALLLTLYCCSSESDGPNNGENQGDLIELTSAFFPAYGYGSSKKIEMKATGPWHIVLNENYKSWVKVTPESGNGGEIIELQVTVSRNESQIKEREASFDIVLNSDEECRAEVKILQPTEYYLMQDSITLRTIYEKLDGNNWKVKWPTNIGVRSWPGVMVTEASKVERVTSIWFGYPINMKGELPEEIGNLDALLGFAIKGEQNVTGTIPGEAFAKTNIEQLWIDSTNISGLIPAALNNCSNMMSLNVPNNKLTGFEEGFGTVAMPNLVGLFIQFNQFECSFNSDWIGRMKKMTIMNIRGNRFSGQLPRTMVAGLTNLLQLEIADNCFVGEFPASIKATVAYEQTEAIDMCPQKEGFGFDEGSCKQ
ncbi:MAG: hypothetical protein ACRDDZ_11485 [Marinifilaceae bacterium]